MKDVTGEPRSTRDLEATLRFVERDMLTSPMRMVGDQPALIHLTVIRDVLREELMNRARRGMP